MKVTRPDSENVKLIKYDEKTKKMDVTFHSGATYRYDNISGQKHRAFTKAGSVGAYASTRLENGERIK